MTEARRIDWSFWVAAAGGTFVPVLVTPATFADVVVLYGFLLVTAGLYVAVAYAIECRVGRARFDRSVGLGWMAVVGTFSPLWFFWGILGWDEGTVGGLIFPAFAGTWVMVRVVPRLVDAALVARSRVGGGRV